MPLGPDFHFLIGLDLDKAAKYVISLSSSHQTLEHLTYFHSVIVSWLTLSSIDLVATKTDSFDLLSKLLPDLQQHHLGSNERFDQKYLTRPLEPANQLLIFGFPAKALPNISGTTE